MSRYRDDTIILFQDKNLKQIYCRICVVPPHRRGGFVDHDYFCRGQCCRSSDDTIIGKFNNTKHDIILSESICRICELRGNVCVGRHQCPSGMNKWIHIVLAALKNAHRRYEHG